MIFPTVFWFRGEGEQITPNFHSSEFECKCGVCHVQSINLAIPYRLELVRTDLGGVPLSITSGFRCHYHNLVVDGAVRSRHLKSLASDVRAKGVDPEDLAAVCRKFFKRIGIAAEANFVHVDVDSGEAEWRY